MENKLKKEFDSFINEHYKALSEIAQVFCRNNGDDLLHTTYLTIIDAKTNNGLKNAINKNNLFNFFFVAMRNQCHGSSTSFSKTKLKKHENIDTIYRYEDNLSNDNGYFPTENEIKWLKITEELNKLYENKKIDSYSLQLFRLLYTTEEIINIKGLTKDEVDKIRKMSFRVLSKKTGISATAIFVNVQKTLKLLRG